MLELAPPCRSRCPGIARGSSISIARLRGRPIRVVPTDTAALAHSPCGLWIKRTSDDIIHHEKATSEYHIDQIESHEIGHMVIEHDRPGGAAGTTGNHAELLHSVLPDLDSHAVRAVLGRAEFDSDQERNAEMFASIVMLAEVGSQKSMMSSVFFRR
ncbi:hypothetical protein [Mycobacterium riyadhense]|uniref:hypothetical protein n=1 Tax=Mycobacterium riyadhense TaxID=486698 RepID=UPI00195E6E2D|nr:hypothetical protein [Mycobacterium riyadhense]